MGERRSGDEVRRDRERALLAASPGADSGRARVAFAAEERRRGQLENAALALEEALREGTEPSVLGPELAALIAADPGEPGARRAAACFAAVLPRHLVGPFPHVQIARSAALLIARDALFRGVFRVLPLGAIRSLVASLGRVVKGERAGIAGRQDVRGVLSRDDIDDDLAEDLADVREMLIEVRRHRVCARLDTPGPLREASHTQLNAGEGTIDLAIADSHVALIRRDTTSGRILLHEERSFAGQPIPAEGVVLDGTSEDLEPRVVAAAGGSFVFGIDRETAVLHVSFSAFGRFDAGRGELDVGKQVKIAAACACARGLAIFLAPLGQVLVATTRGAIERAPSLASLEVVDAASHGALDVFVLAREPERVVLVKLDPGLEPIGEAIAVPPLRAPREARLAWPTKDMVLVLDAPDTAHAFGADDRRFAWTARLSRPLEEISAVTGEALELLAFGAIESEWGLAGADVGLARWTRDGLGRHGPTVRVESVDPSRALDLVRVATHGRRIAVAALSGTSLTLRTLEVLSTPATIPPASEWTFALGEIAPDQE